VKKVKWLRDLAKKGDKAISMRMGSYLTVHDQVSNVDDAMKAVMAKIKTMQVEDVTRETLVLGVIDFNVPHSTTAENLQEYCIFASRSGPRDARHATRLRNNANK